MKKPLKSMRGIRMGMIMPWASWMSLVRVPTTSPTAAPMTERMARTARKVRYWPAVASRPTKK